MNKTLSLTGFFLAAVIGLAGMQAASSGAVPDAVNDLVKSRCAGCHKGMFAPKGLNLKPENLEKDVLDVPSKEKPDLKLVDSSKPESSYLLMKIRGAEGISGKRMPAGKPPLTEDEIKILSDWVMSLKKGDAVSGR
jgi:mono/diheme cytochrome c family protein